MSKSASISFTLSDADARNLIELVADESVRWQEKTWNKGIGDHLHKFYSTRAEYFGSLKEKLIKQQKEQVAKEGF